MKTFDVTASLGELVRQSPARAQIFERLGLEYCCLGNSSLKDACRAKKMDLATVANLLQYADNSGKDLPDPAQALTPPELCGLIEQQHSCFATVIPQVKLLVKKAYPHPSDCTRHATRLRVSIGALCAQISKQIEFEQTRFFPFIRQTSQGGGQSGTPAICDRQSRHLTTTAAGVRRIRTLTHDFTPPDRSCATIFTLYAALWNLDRHTRHYVHLQQNILLPMLRC